MCILGAIAACAALLMAVAAAQNRDQPPYRPVPIVLPKPVSDEAFDALRKQVSDVAQRKDRAALANLVIAQGFFWQRENRNVVDKNKSGYDVLAAALGLNNKESAGWEILASYADDPSASPSPDHPGALCAPGGSAL